VFLLPDIWLLGKRRQVAALARDCGAIEIELVRKRMRWICDFDYGAG
jgi:hypothetical protein